MSELHPSVKATYDSRETGPRYNVTSKINGRPVVFMKSIEDPFVRHTVHVGIVDLVRALFRGRLELEVTVGGDLDVVNDVLELDDNNLIPGRTRKAAFNQHLNERMGQP